MDPLEVFREHAIQPIALSDIRGEVCEWDKLVRIAADLPAIATIGLASQWNALIQDPTGHFVPSEETRIADTLLSPKIASKVSAARKSRLAGGGPPPPFPPPVLHRWQLCILMQLILRDGTWDRSAPDSVSQTDLACVLLGITDHMHGRSTRRGTFQLLSEMLAIWDISHSRDIGPGIVRTGIMLDEIALKKRRDIDLRTMFLLGAGIEIEDFLFLALASGYLGSQHGTNDPPGTVSASGRLDLPNLTVPRVKGSSAVTADVIKRFLDLLSDEPAAFKSKLADVGQLQTDLSTLRRRPMIRMGPGNDGEPIYRLLDRTFLLDKLSDGVFYVTVAAGKAAGLKPEAVPSAWGELFEEFIHEMVAHSHLAAAYTPSPELVAGGARGEGADAMVLNGTDVVMLEYKVSPLTAPARSGSDARCMAADLFRKFAGSQKSRKGVRQLVAGTTALLNGGQIGPATLGSEGAVYPVLVCWDSIVDAPMVNHLFQRAFRHWLRSSDPRVKPLTVISIETFELMVSAINEKVSLPDLLNIYHREDPRMINGPERILSLTALKDLKHATAWLEEHATAWRNKLVLRHFPNGELARRLRTQASPGDDVE